MEENYLTIITPEPLSDEQSIELAQVFERLETRQEEKKVQFLREGKKEKAQKIIIYRIPINKERLQQLKKEGQFMEMEAEFSVIQDHLRTFNKACSIVALVEKNNKKAIRRYVKEYLYKDKIWEASASGYVKEDVNGEEYNKLEIRMANDGFEYTERDTVGKKKDWRGSPHFSILPSQEKELPFIVELSKTLKANAMILYSVKERRMDKCSSRSASNLATHLRSMRTLRVGTSTINLWPQ